MKSIRKVRDLSIGVREIARTRRSMQRGAAPFVGRGRVGLKFSWRLRAMDRQQPVVGIQRRSWHRCPVLLVALLLAAPVIARETIVLQKSATDQQLRGGDATLNQGSPTSNNVGTTVTVESLSSANVRAIIEFDLSRIPNVGIKQALLTLHVITPPSASAGTLTYGAYDVQTFWQPSTVTWDARVATTNWGIPGGDKRGARQPKQNQSNTHTTTHSHRQ